MAQEMLSISTPPRAWVGEDLCDCSYALRFPRNGTNRNYNTRLAGRSVQNGIRLVGYWMKGSREYFTDPKLSMGDKMMCVVLGSSF